jgi:hypothetical protein
MAMAVWPNMCLKRADLGVTAIFIAWDWMLSRIKHANLPFHRPIPRSSLLPFTIYAPSTRCTTADLYPATKGPSHTYMAPHGAQQLWCTGKPDKLRRLSTLGCMCCLDVTTRPGAYVAPFTHFAHTFAAPFGSHTLVGTIPRIHKSGCVGRELYPLLILPARAHPLTKTVALCITIYGTLPPRRARFYPYWLYQTCNIPKCIIGLRGVVEIGQETSAGGYKHA